LQTVVLKTKPALQALIRRHQFDEAIVIDQVEVNYEMLSVFICLI